MKLKEEFIKLRDEFTATEDEVTRARISSRIEELTAAHPEEASAAFLESIDDAMERISAETVREHLAPVLDVLQVKHIAEKYLRKTPSWFSQRLNGNKVGGKRMAFKVGELREIEEAIRSIGKELADFSFPESVVKHEGKLG